MNCSLSAPMTFSIEVEPLVETLPLSEQFMADNSGVSVTYDPTGSGAGIEAAGNGSADIGLASRALKDEEKAGGLTETVVALDGIAVIVNADSKVEDLSVEQIAKIFTGEITDWSEVGGEAGKISCIGREAGSGTRDGFESITGTRDACKLDQELTSTGGVIEAVAGNVNAIGYASLSAVEGKDTVKAVTVGGIACTEETVLDGSYAIQRPFVLVTKTDAPLSTAAQAFFDYASTAANDLIKAAGAGADRKVSTMAAAPHLSGGRGRKALRRPAASQRRAPTLENLIHLIFLLCGVVAVAFVLLISIYLILSGIPAIRESDSEKFLFGKVWDPTNTTTGAQYGILAFILTSIYGTAGAILIGVPVGLLTAVFLARVAPPRLAAVIRTAVQPAAGIPSVVYGLVGMIVLVPAIQKTFSSARARACSRRSSCWR